MSILTPSKNRTSFETRTSIQYHKLWTTSKHVYKKEAFDQHLFLSKSEAAIHYGSHYHRQRSLDVRYPYAS